MKEKRCPQYCIHCMVELTDEQIVKEEYYNSDNKRRIRETCNKCGKTTSVYWSRRKTIMITILYTVIVAMPLGIFTKRNHDCKKIYINYINNNIDGVDTEHIDWGWRDYIYCTRCYMPKDQTQVLRFEKRDSEGDQYTALECKKCREECVEPITKVWFYTIGAMPILVFIISELATYRSNKRIKIIRNNRPKNPVARNG